MIRLGCGGPQMRQQTLFLRGSNAVRFDFTLGREQPLVLGIHIRGVQALGDPEFQVGVLALVERFVVGHELVQVAAVVVHLLQNGEFDFIVKLLHGE
ncbi:MAG: hypothetical protein IPM98_11010 [Lewinellaceae bacterium]|nr:hypothetical protein [Lewinellaceae bacterium]